MEKPIEITDENYDKIISTDKPVLIDFWAEWCGPCIMTNPIVQELANDYKDLAVVGKLDYDANPQIAAKFGIRSIPTFLILKNGLVVDKQVGAVNKMVLAKKLDTQLEQV